MLVHPLKSSPTELWCDASNIAVGAVLVQLQKGRWSRQLNEYFKKAIRAPLIITAPFPY